MDLKTSLAYQLAKGRLRQIDTYVERAEDLQSHQLRHLLDRARHTEFGRSYSLDKTTTSTDFTSRVPIQDYEGCKGDIERMVRGEKDILVPGICRWYAKSSGTTSDRSKFIPVPALHLNDCHYRGGRDALWIYLRNNPRVSSSLPRVSSSGEVTRRYRSQVARPTQATLARSWSSICPY